MKRIFEELVIFVSSVILAFLAGLWVIYLAGLAFSYWGQNGFIGVMLGAITATVYILKRTW